MRKYEQAACSNYETLASTLNKICSYVPSGLSGCRLVFLFVAVLLTGCAKSPTQVSKSPEFEYIQEYAYSPEKNMLALVVPVGSYSRQTGLEHSQIIILDSESWEVLYSKEFSDFGPYNLQWTGDGKHLLYMSNDLRRENPNLINWDLTTGHQTEQPFFHTGFTVSNSGDSLVAWGTLQSQENGEVIEVMDGQLHFYSLPDVKKYDSMTILPGNDLEVRYAVWSQDDKELLALGQLNRPPALHTIYRLDLSSGTQEVEVADVSTWNSFSWDSAHDLVAFTNVFGVDIYHSGYDCYIAHIDFAHTPYDPMWDALTLTLIKDEGPRQGLNQLIAVNLDHLASVGRSECLE
jgi:hypothetical protein